MKHILIAIVALLLHVRCDAQGEVIQLYEGGHYLNSGSNAKVAGDKSRICVPINVPYDYTNLIIRTTINTSERVDSLNMTQAAISVAGSIAKLSDLSAALNTTTSHGVVDFYLLATQNCANYFLKKERADCYMLYRQKGMPGGTVDVSISPRKATYYLCYLNPDDANGVPIYVEAIAIRALPLRTNIEKYMQPEVDSVSAEEVQGRSRRRGYLMDEKKYNKEFKFRTGVLK